MGSYSQEVYIFCSTHL